jgi:hypothetical protein
MSEAVVKQTNQQLPNTVIACLLYPIGDLIGQLLLGDFNLERTICIALVGSLLYRFEVPAWFRFIDQLRVSDKNQKRFALLFSQSEPDNHPLNWLGRTIGSMLYFNPLWIARHVFIIYMSTHHMQLNMAPLAAVGHFILTGLKAFLTNMPISIIGNYIIQQKLKPQQRFLGSATLSGIFSITYAIEYILFK